MERIGNKKVDNDGRSGVEAHYGPGCLGEQYMEKSAAEKIIRERK